MKMVETCTWLLELMVLIAVQKPTIAIKNAASEFCFHDILPDFGFLLGHEVHHSHKCFKILLLFFYEASRTQGFCLSSFYTCSTEYFP